MAYSQFQIRSKTRRAAWSNCTGPQAYCCHGLRGNAFVTPNRAETVCRRSLHADAAKIDTENVRNPLAHRVTMRRDFWLLANQRDVDMRDDTSQISYEGSGLLQKNV